MKTSSVGIPPRDQQKEETIKMFIAKIKAVLQYIAIAMDCNELLNPESVGVLLLLFVTPSRTASRHKMIVFVRLFPGLARWWKKNRWLTSWHPDSSQVSYLSTGAPRMYLHHQVPPVHPHTHKITGFALCPYQALKKNGKKHHVKTLEALFVYPKKKGDIHLAMLAKSSPIFACCIGNTSDLLAIFTWVHLTNNSKGTSHRIKLIHDSHPPKFNTSPLKSYRAPRSERILLKKNIVFQGRTVWVCIQWTKCAPSNPFHQGCVLSSPSTWQCPASWWT